MMANAMLPAIQERNCMLGSVSRTNDYHDFYMRYIQNNWTYI